MTREEYLNKAARSLWPALVAAGATEPSAWRVSCGFPKGGRGNKRIGECWDASASGDSTYELFISPTIADSGVVLATLVHELIHAGVGLKCGHKGAFKTVARAAGLVGKLTATTAGPELQARLNVIIADIGAYPHAAMTLAVRIKQGTRMIKCECQECGYTCRTTAKWLDTGTPLCHCNSEPMAIA